MWMQEVFFDMAPFIDFYTIIYCAWESRRTLLKDETGPLHCDLISKEPVPKKDYTFPYGVVGVHAIAGTSFFELIN